MLTLLHVYFGVSVILVEAVSKESNKPDLCKLRDIEILGSPGGKERTAAEYKDLFERAGLRLTRIAPTQSPYSVIEAVKLNAGGLSTNYADFQRPKTPNRICGICG